MGFYWNAFGMLDGERPNVRTAEQRRALKDVTTEAFEKAFPDVLKLKTTFTSNGGNIIEDYFQTSRGKKLFSRTLVPDAERTPIRGAVLYCHGYTDDIQFQSQKPMYTYANLGYIVVAVEMEGHGLSDGRNSLLPDLKAAVKDAHEFLTMSKEKFAGYKWLVHGESMGGMFALNLALLEQKEGTPFDGLVLVCPMCKIADDVKPPKALINTLLFLAKHFPSLAVTPSSMDDRLVFRDQSFVEKVKSNPIKYIGKPRLATAATLFKSTVELESRMEELETPFLVIHGLGDVVTTPEASRELYNRANVSEENKKLILLEDQWHGFLWAEAPDAVEENWKSILDWALSRV